MLTWWQALQCRLFHRMRYGREVKPMGDRAFSHVRLRSYTCRRPQCSRYWQRVSYLAGPIVVGRPWGMFDRKHTDMRSNQRKER